MKRRRLVILWLALLCGVGCADEKAKKAAHEMTGGDPDSGKVAIENRGCAACHTIPGIPGAYGLVGPSLAEVSSRNYIGGVLENKPENMLRWLTDPPSVSTNTAMPNLGLDAQEVRDIASYLYTLK
jgi:cytochrome c